MKESANQIKLMRIRLAYECGRDPKVRQLVEGANLFEYLEKLLQIGTGVYETAIYSAVGDVGSIETTVSALGYMGSAMVTLGIAAAFGVFWFGLTVWLMRNKLNLE